MQESRIDGVPRRRSERSNFSSIVMRYEQVVMFKRKSSSSQSSTRSAREEWQAGIDETFQKIRAVHNINEEIIATVEATQEAISFRYAIAHTTEGLVDLKETPVKLKVADLIREHKFTAQFETEIWELFHDNRNNNGAKSWDDLKRLNHALMVIVEKFELFERPKEKAKTELLKYLHDFEVIQVGLGEMQAQTLSHPSRLNDLQDHVKRINENTVLLLQEIASINPRQPAPVMDFASGLLSQRLIQQLIGWYGRRWKLQYKATRDGWSTATFHELCDGKGPTVTIIKANGSLFGGYLRVSWESDGTYIVDSFASLFTLRNKFSVAPTQFSIRDSCAAAISTEQYGHTFGGGHDIHISNDASSNDSSYSRFPHSYVDQVGKGKDIFAGAEKFTPDEIEVYIMLKN